MASPEVLDFDRLLQPIEGENPAGSDLRADTSPTSVYYQVKDARSNCRAVERQAQMMGEGESADADWRPVLDAAPDVIATVSKDLEMTAYLIESLVRQHGFVGLRDGFRLARELVEQFGDSLYPLPDEDGEETRLAPLSGLNGDDGPGTLVGPITNASITGSTSVGAFGSAQYEQAVELDRSPPEVVERRLSQGAVSLAMFNTAVAETEATEFRDLLEDINAAADEFGKLTALLDERFGNDSPPSSNISHALAGCRETIETIARDKLATLEVVPSELEEEEGETGAASGEKKAGAIETRDDAFRELQRIADFFRRTEPHTPISYAIEQIIRWGRLPLPDLMKELLADDASVEQLFRLVGIRSDQPEEE